MTNLQPEIFLSELSDGDRATVVRFTGHSSAIQRMEEMGLVLDEEIEFIQKAPLGNPIEIQIKGYLLSLRQEEAKLVIVKKKEEKE